MSFMLVTGVVLTSHGEESVHLIDFKDENPCYDPYQLCQSLNSCGSGFQICYITVGYGIFTFLLYRVFHLLLTIVFQALIMRDMEKLTGGVRVAIIYLGAGLGGNLASAIFLPYHVEVGMRLRTCISMTIAVLT